MECSKKFRTKRELLRHLGKNEDDRKLVDRMMLKWEVVMSDRMYILVDSKKELIEEIKNLKEQLSKVSNPDLEEELNEAKIQWEYYERMYNEELLDKQNKIRKCFQWIKQIKPNANWEEFRDWVMWD